MQFPISIAFKLFALGPQMYVTDAAGKSLGYVRQKLMREDVTIFENDRQAKPIYSIKPNRMIGYNKVYRFADAQGYPLGSVARGGKRSLWRVHYVINVADEPRLDGHGNLNPFCPIPMVYLVSRGEQGVLLIAARRSLFENDVEIDQLGWLGDRERECALLAVMMIILIESAKDTPSNAV